MKKQIILLSLFVQAFAVHVLDENRSMLGLFKYCKAHFKVWYSECPEGYSYYGEVAVTDFPRDYMVEGGRTPTYSCYQLHQGNFDWVDANQKSVHFLSIILSTVDSWAQ